MREQGRQLREADGGRDQEGTEVERARQALDVLARVMDLSDPATSEHSRDIAAIVERVGERLGLTKAACEELVLAARFHDVGKVAVPEKVLRKPGPLDEDEWELMACHVEWGAQLLRHLPDCASVAHVVRHHHERFDGTGYPDGLKGTEIPLASRIISVCDAYGAMLSDRPYRRALDPARAREELRREAGKQFDPGAVDAILATTEPA